MTINSSPLGVPLKASSSGLLDASALRKSTLRQSTGIRPALQLGVIEAPMQDKALYNEVALVLEGVLQTVEKQAAQGGRLLPRYKELSEKVEILAVDNVQRRRKLHRS